MKILEGTIANIPPKGGRKHPEQSLLPINTSNILFICGGSFSGLEEIIASRIGKNSLGFNSDKDVKNKKETPFHDPIQEDLISYGMIPELVGRLPILTTLDELDEEDLLKVMVKPKNSIVKQYQKLFLIEGVVLEFNKSALFEIVRLAMEKKSGARAFRSVIEEKLMDLMFHLPDMKGIERIVITKETITTGKDPEFKKIKKRKSA